MSQKHVIVTGGAGYIGSHTIIELLENTSYHVISIDNFSNSYHSCSKLINQVQHSIQAEKYSLLKAQKKKSSPQGKSLLSKKES